MSENEEWWPKVFGLVVKFRCYQARSEEGKCYTRGWCEQRARDSHIGEHRGNSSRPCGHRKKRSICCRFEK